MKILKIVASLVLVYVGIVILFESLLGYFQPETQTTLVITTTDEAGVATDRVLAQLASNDQIYVSANHWPRAWYNQVLNNPEVQATIGGEQSLYIAVPVTSQAEYDRVNSDNKHSIGFRILTGFAPRYFIRLVPR